MFGEQLTEILEKYKIKNRKLALLTGITEGFISDIKRGRSVPRKDNLIAILDNLPLTKEEREHLYEEWEREVSPDTFVKKYDELSNKYRLLLNAAGGEEEGRTKIEIQRINEKYIEKIEAEKEKYKIYYELFMMLDEDERKFTIKQIISNIEFNLRTAGKYEENKEEIDFLKDCLKHEIEYEF
ncbi:MULTISPECIES: helix-turn-helix transcriptional regulator [unclassified Fusobacterium]|uniref:helix-turn-helix domain-containing protein n=1 Tax=unclassified Fusobacterium TaxID=2648384 RepID=UPI001B8B8F41|nr:MULTISPECIES: helix-turn-helix transcriptional regulator [unclassified Fusobacterium]MBR8702280.1 hypothetical protein [Fusobacterium sp. DD45]MBR8712097.1 hypothetical protein [Fusobacterium sp. DD28]MBR8752681.1 hypothetical protein [Fusobacterium sp. DD26]